MVFLVKCLEFIECKKLFIVKLLLKSKDDKKRCEFSMSFDGLENGFLFFEVINLIIK